MTKEIIEKAVKAKGYKWFEGGDYDVNIVSVRNSSTGKKVTNLFDDTLTLSYLENGVWKFKSWAVTTDPGKYYMQVKLGNPKGTARLKEGQYRGSHQIGLHNGKYEALVQTGNVLLVWRDSNKDGIYDENDVDEGWFGINIHMAGEDSKTVDNYSAGCTVFKRKKDFLEFMAIIKKSRNIWGNKFTYTLINSNDL